MKLLGYAAAALGATATGALAAGLDRSGQPIGLIFQDGNYAEISLGYVDPSVDGNDTFILNFLPAGAPAPAIGNVADSFVQVGAGVKFQYREDLSFSLIFDQPFGADVLYEGEQNSSSLGGTSASADTSSITAVARYHINENFSVHGGLRYQRAEGNITLSGLSYGGPAGPGSLNGYNVDLAQDGAFGYVAGVAYERPEIALRVALTYNSEIKHKFETVETVNGIVINPGSITEIETPASLNLDFQTGVAEDTLVFGSIRRSNWSDFKISPAGLVAATGDPNTSISDFDDGTAYSLGVGRRFNEKFSGSLSIGYEPKGDSDLLSPLGPTDGNTSLAVGGRYQVNETTTLSAGIRYTRFGDARPETGTPDTERALFRDNDAVSVGVNLGWSF